MGPRSRFHSRSLRTLVAGQVQKVGWNGCTGLDGQCHAELDFWNDNLRSLNGARIRVEGLVKDLDARDLVSDAGDMLVGVTEFKDGVEDVSKRMQEPLCEGDLESPVRIVSCGLSGWLLRREVSRWLGRRCAGSQTHSQLLLF